MATKMTIQQFKEVIARQDKETMTFEKKQIAIVAKPLRDYIRVTLAKALSIIAVYEHAHGKLDDKQPMPRDLQIQLQRFILARATGPRVLPSKAAYAAVKAAINMGVKHAVEVLGIKLLPGRRPQLSKMLDITVSGIDLKMMEALRDAKKFIKANSITKTSDVVTSVAKLNSVVKRVEVNTSWVVNRAINEGTQHVARETKSDKLWVSEVDGCLTCLAYAGHVVAYDQDFPAGLTFGKKSTVKHELECPPAHPWCRCRCQLWFGSDKRVGAVELPEVLKREAQRSVLRGVAQDSERQKVLAADKLLKRGTNLPKTVRQRAARAVSTGAFGSR